MKLSAKSRYAARILLELARRKTSGPQAASLLSRYTGVSTQFIEQILKPLKRAGITNSVRGAAGGHILNMPAETISLGDIVRTMEGGIHLTLCSDEERYNCPKKDLCLTHKAWESLSKNLEREMDAIKLTDLLEQGMLPGSSTTDCQTTS